MRIFNVLMAILLMIGQSISASSQSRADSSVIANKDLRKAAILIEQGKGCAQELKLQEQYVNTLSKRIELKDSTIAAYEIKGKGYEGLIANYKAQSLNFEEQVKIVKDDFEAIQKDLRRQKRKTAFIELVSAGVIGYLLLK